MGDVTMDLAADDAVEAILQDGLARETRAAAAVVPVLRHLLGSEGHGLVSDAIVARVRGMVQHCAAQLLAAEAGQDPVAGLAAAGDMAAIDALAETLTADAGLLSHCHALAAESLIAERLHQRLSLDPVLSPLLQELIAAEDPAIAALAMSTLAAQSRFMQGQRRMELPLGELPAELFHGLAARIAGAPAQQLGARYDEATSRLGLLARLVGAMRRGVVAALSIDHAGLALFASAAAAQTRCPREKAVLACHESQALRLGLLLRGAGLLLPAIERQLPLLNPGAGPLPLTIDMIMPERAIALLAASDQPGQ